MTRRIGSALAVAFVAAALVPGSALAASPFTSAKRPADNQYGNACPPASHHGKGGKHGNGKGKKCGHHGTLGAHQHSKGHGRGGGSGATNESSGEHENAAVVPASTVAARAVTGQNTGGGLPFTGAGWLGVAALIGVLLVAAGSVLVVGARVRRRILRARS